jgi:hypothetical protein
VKLAGKYPEVISNIQGKGLMIGIYLNKETGKDNVFFRMMFQQELAGYLFSAWLFHKHQIRIFPSLAAANCLRVEPSCYISETQIDKFCSALEELCKLCKEKRIYSLLSFLMNDDIYDDRNETIFDGKLPIYLEEPLPGAKKVGFISHFTFPLAELKLIEPDLQNASDTGLRILFNKMQLLMEGKPFKILSKNLMNGKVHFSFYLIPVDATQLENAHKWGKKRNFISKMQDAVDMLAMENVSHISLGGYASILTNNGLMLAQHPKTKIITGNTLTAASCLHFLYKYVNSFPDNKQLKIAIVGATGNIGNGLAECIAENKSINCSLLLIGHNVKKSEQNEGNIHIENLLRNIKQPSSQQKIALPYRDGYEFIEVTHIIYCQADGAYTKVFLHNKKCILVSKTLGDIEELLPPDLFMRIHHSTVVNLNNVTHFVRTDGGYIKLQTGEQLTVSKSKRDVVMARLGLKKD